MNLIAWLILLGGQALLAGQSPEAAVRAVLDEQVRAWNQGDLPAFVRTYSTTVTGRDSKKSGQQLGAENVERAAMSAIRLTFGDSSGAKPARACTTFTHGA